MGHCEVPRKPKTKVIVVVGVSKARGRNSMVECQLPKLEVAGSIPVARSIFLSKVANMGVTRQENALFTLKSQSRRVAADVSLQKRKAESR